MKPCRLVDSTSASNAFSALDHRTFELRGRSYLVDNEKFPSKPPVFRCCGVSIQATKKPTFHCAENIPQLKKYLSDNANIDYVMIVPHDNQTTYPIEPHVEVALKERWNVQIRKYDVDGVIMSRLHTDQWENYIASGTNTHSLGIKSSYIRFFSLKLAEEYQV